MKTVLRVAVVVVIVGAVAAAAIFGVDRLARVTTSPEEDDDAASDGPAPVALTQTLKSSDGLVTVHFPDGYEGKMTPGANGSTIHVKKTGRADVSFEVKTAKVAPRSARDLMADLVKSNEVLLKDEGATYTPGPRRDDKCHGLPGVWESGTITLAGRTATLWACTLVRRGHGYAFTLVFADDRAADEETLRRILTLSELR